MSVSSYIVRPAASSRLTHILLAPESDSSLPQITPPLVLAPRHHWITKNE